MANPAHLEKLCEGPKAWNTWRDANPNIVPDLSEIQLTLHQRQLGPSNGGPIDLHAANLEHAILRYATLSGADLEGSRLIGADLTHARLDKARLTGADLTDAILDQADMTGAVLEQAVLFGADLSDTRNLTIPQIEQAFGDGSTKLPSNLLPPESWFPIELDDDDDDDYAGWGMPAYEEPVEQTLYEVLGLTEKATSEEIRASYRILVKKLHPDLNPNDAEAQDRFKQVTTAYRILNDAAQRQRYDKGEIDGEGRVNPEFEARRRFRRTAYRYYAAAAGSFMLACFVLVGVWYTVLSFEPPPQEDAPPQVVTITGPKRSERLGDGVLQAPVTIRPEKDLALLEEGSDSPEAAPEDEAASQDAPAASPGDEAKAEAAEDTPAHDEQDENPELSGDKPVEAAAQEDASQPADSATAAAAPPPESAAATPESAPTAPESAAQDAAQPVPAVPPSDPAPGQSVQSPQPAPEMRQAAASPQPAPQQKGTPQRPLREGHNGFTGQTKPSAPEGWSVGALPAASQPGWTPGADKIQTGSSQPRIRKAVVSRPAQHPAGRDLVSQVLRTRAIRQALGEGKWPLSSAEKRAPQGRNASINVDVPTEALSSSPNTFPGQGLIPPPTKPTSANLQRKPASSRPAPGSPAATAGKPAANKQPVSPQAQNRGSRQKQAVTDVVAGGL